MASAPSAPSAVEIRQYRHDEVAGGGLELFGSPFSSAWRFHLARQWTGSGGCVSAPADPAVVSSLRLSSCTFFLSERWPHGPSSWRVSFGFDGNFELLRGNLRLPSRKGGRILEPAR
jgi:hypothetical protein